MDAVQLLTADHDRMRRMFRRLREAEESGDRDTQIEVALDLAAELDVHQRVEEEIFYPWVRTLSSDLSAAVDEGQEEHHVANVLVDELRDESIEPGSDKWLAKVGVLVENVEHHIDEEEEDMFALVCDASAPGQREERGSVMAARKGELGGTVPTDLVRREEGRPG